MKKIQTFKCSVLPKGDRGIIRLFFEDGTSILLDELKFEQFNSAVLMLRLTAFPVYWDGYWLTNESPKREADLNSIS